VAWKKLTEFEDDQPYRQHALPFLLKLVSAEFAERKMPK
jgi:hypothetical protein